MDLVGRGKTSDGRVIFRHEIARCGIHGRRRDVGRRNRFGRIGRPERSLQGPRDGRPEGHSAPSSEGEGVRGRGARRGRRRQGGSEVPPLGPSSRCELTDRRSRAYEVLPHLGRPRGAGRFGLPPRRGELQGGGGSTALLHHRRRRLLPRHQRGCCCPEEAGEADELHARDRRRAGLGRQGRRGPRLDAHRFERLRPLGRRSPDTPQRPGLPGRADQLDGPHQETPGGLRFDRGQGHRRGGGGWCGAGR
jgi:hypothetical protein